MPCLVEVDVFVELLNVAVDNGVNSGEPIARIPEVLTKLTNPSQLLVSCEPRSLMLLWRHAAAEDHFYVHRIEDPATGISVDIFYVVTNDDACTHRAGASSVAPAGGGSSTSGYNTLDTAPVLQSPPQSRSQHQQLPDEDELVDYAAPVGVSAAAPSDANDSLLEVCINYAPGNAVFDKCSNVVTSKYSLARDSIPSISNTHGYPTNAPVLFFVISIGAVFAVMEDLRRHKADSEANSATCHVIQDGHVVDRKWADIKMGDFLQIRNREVIPGGVLVLAVSEPPSGICYVASRSTRSCSSSSTSPCATRLRKPQCGNRDRGDLGVGQRVSYEILDVLEFNSTRKRMSVVVRKPNGELLLYTKGADMMICQRLKDDPAMMKLKIVTRDHMEKYADDGLRTLAMKSLDERWFQQWKMRFDGKPNAIDAMMEEIEEGLELIGATAIQDKLQCLANLKVKDLR
ncbi:hypothetical protein PR002_g26571 [Phytophthora rubi]|uniref:Uncharacterized protein n=1 Tax=Phytophthora rubi TaxID=129364 RepID=A0A6A3HVI3_9STRA|nr:hypothetical protein PR002_g26571 [Phytophthora rubi]